MFGFKKAVVEEGHTCDVCGFVYVAQIAVTETETICVACFLEGFLKANGNG